MERTGSSTGDLGHEDLHLPLGVGSAVVHALRSRRYDGTVTIEIFAREADHIETSARLWRKWWEQAPLPRTS